VPPKGRLLPGKSVFAPPTRDDVTSISDFVRVGPSKSKRVSPAGRVLAIARLFVRTQCTRTQYLQRDATPESLAWYPFTT
jgi:hypothetical protein